MNQADVAHICQLADQAATALHKHGPPLLKATKDWQSPLRSGGGPSSKGDHSDPTAATAITPDPLALEHQAFVAELQAFQRAAMALLSGIERRRPLTEAEVERGRISTDPGCVACGGPAPVGHRRAGQCDACRKAWERAGRPDLTTFRRMRQREADDAARVLHEHEVA